MTKNSAAEKYSMSFLLGKSAVQNETKTNKPQKSDSFLLTNYDIPFLNTNHLIIEWLDQSETEYY
jgi:hypothetical protein